MLAVESLKEHLKPGQVYRRSDLERWSKSVDRHLAALLKEGFLRKANQGLYYVPEQTVFGKAPPDDNFLVRRFLNDHRYLMFSPNLYNGLGLGLTQLRNLTVVYNHKRHGEFSLNGKVFDFRLKPRFPSTLTKEFLLVDLVNNLDSVGEDREMLLKKVKQKAMSMDQKRLKRSLKQYAHVSTSKFFQEFLDV